MDMTVKEHLTPLYWILSALPSSRDTSQQLLYMWSNKQASLLLVAKVILTARENKK